jgi:hypothetical protein
MNPNINIMSIIVRQYSNCDSEIRGRSAEVKICFAVTKSWWEIYYYEKYHELKSDENNSSYEFIYRSGKLF